LRIAASSRATAGRFAAAAAAAQPSPAHVLDQQPVLLPRPTDLILSYHQSIYLSIYLSIRTRFHDLISLIPDKI
jgi:hypothetical protein